MNKETSNWLPWTAQQRFDRNQMAQIPADLEDKSLPSNGNEPLEIRSLSIDLARNFHSVDMIKKTIGEMKELKMTHLHLHLTDDEGWRLGKFI